MFTSGKGHLDPQRPRLKLKKDWTNGLTPEQLAAHNTVLETANQHIAHRVNDLEQVVVAALLTPPPMRPTIAGVGTMVVHMVAPEPVVAERLVSICDLLLGAAQQENENLSSKLTEQLTQENIGSLYEAAEAQAHHSVN